MEQKKGFVYLICAFSLAGTSVISGKYLSENLSPFAISAISLFFAIVCLLPICARDISITIMNMSREDWLLLILQAFFGIFLFRAFLLYGLKNTSAGEAGILTGVTPAATVLFARFVLKETLNRFSFIGIGCTITGIILLERITSTENGLSSGHIIGNIMVICAALSESSFNIISRINSMKSSTSNGAPLNPLVQTTIVSAIAFLLCAISSLFDGGKVSLTEITIQEWGALIWYGVFVTALAFIFWYAGIKRCKASSAAAFSGMMPFSSLILSVLLLGESVNLEQWLGGLMVIFSIFIIGKKPQDKIIEL